jgi:Asp-tRNA(Asn)/Glu-tRNA(Gln) amidotransferase A subunit family amidase/acyl-ACP thioesterase
MRLSGNHRVFQQQKWKKRTMTLKSDWQQETRVRSYEAGADGRASLTAICNLLQECATEHAEHLGIGYEPMKRRQLAWAVARMGIDIQRRPVAREELAVQTWTHGTRGPFAMREFVILDASSGMVARATYAWLAIDTKSRKPVRPSSLVAGLPPPPDRPSFDAPLGKIPNPGDPIPGDMIRVRQSDIDMHGHVNNTRYITWIEDALAVADGEQEIVGLHVNFLAEGFSGDTINTVIGTASDGGRPPNGTSPGVGIGPPGKIVVLTRAEDGVDLIRAQAALCLPEEPAGMALSSTTQLVREETLASASKIAGLDLTPSEIAMALKTVAGFQDDYRKRRAVNLDNRLSPAVVFMPGDHADLPRIERAAQEQPESPLEPGQRRPASAASQVPDLPADETDIAYAPLRHLSEWLRNGAVSSTRLCELYFDRIRRFDPVLLCMITLTKELAFEQAKRADEELARGVCRGQLHGIPWGAKDLLDTKGILTTWGAAPYKERVPSADSAVVRLLDNAGAVLLGKLTLGALAYGDIWFGGKTKNPWNTQQGSSGSSAGPAAAAVAGLAGFCIGSETMGSIVSPSLRCGAAGLRPSFGRVPRTGAMALSWSYDKLGPICRRVEDSCFVLEAISAADPGDPGSKDLPFAFNFDGSIEGMRIGYGPDWFATDKEGVGYTDLLNNADKALADRGAELVEVSLPKLPYETLYNLITIDAAAAFEELTLSDRDDELVWQEPDAWPNSFRAARFFPAVEYVQLQRFRRMVMQEMEKVFEKVDAIVSPEQRSSLLVITNSTGQPSLTIRAGFRDDGTPFGLNVWGRYAGEETICRIGMILEGAFGAADKRPPGFD